MDEKTRKEYFENLKNVTWEQLKEEWKDNPNAMDEIEFEESQGYKPGDLKPWLDLYY